MTHKGQKWPTYQSTSSSRRATSTAGESATWSMRIFEDTAFWGPTPFRKSKRLVKSRMLTFFWQIWPKNGTRYNIFYDASALYHFVFCESFGYVFVRFWRPLVVYVIFFIIWDVKSLKIFIVSFKSRIGDSIVAF